MMKNNIANIKLEYFSFSTKLHVGEFLEAKQVIFFISAYFIETREI